MSVEIQMLFGVVVKDLNSVISHRFTVCAITGLSARSKVAEYLNDRNVTYSNISSMPLKKFGSDFEVLV